MSKRIFVDGFVARIVSLSVAGALLVFAGQSVLAGELSYSYVDVGYTDGAVDYAGSDEDFDGFRFAGSVELGEMFFVSGSYEDADTGTFTDDFGDRVSIDLKLLRLGVGLHGALNDGLDWVVSADYADLEADVDDSFLGSFSEDHSGYILDLGVRGLVGDVAEYSFAIIQSDVIESDTGFRLGGRYHFGDSNVSAGLDYVRYGSDWDQLELGVRYQFD